MDVSLTILQGDALEQLQKLPAESVHCCVTSPPYWGLRDYGVEGQLGLEKTPEEYIEKMVAVFREVKRVLRKDGVLFCNMGDSYWGGKGQSNYAFQDRRTSETINGEHHNITGMDETRPQDGNHPILKPKDLCGIPWRLAFALQADGWYLRSDIIWAKPNPMPESVTDRPTKAHEYIFLLSKSERYYYDQESIRESSLNPLSEEEYQEKTGKGKGGWGDSINKRNGYDKHDGGRSHPNGRNKRSVWTVPSFAFPGSHFATFPPDLIKPCILAGASARGCCAKCGAPRERVLEKVKGIPASFNGSDFRNGKKAAAANALAAVGQCERTVETKTIDWQPTCQCNADTAPCTVLDPFGGSGTTGMVALELGRKAILIELNPKYVEMIQRRCNVTMGFNF